ncbi:GPI transamidase component PIG-S isoform X2 [Maniola jurtina]|uniref:GPI transamidase component PIG-S isoform X2 n=1 Tax=Maniola jurtina TaxID=191418 RepID=UPI001E68B625|nr:GPI transamidase component PIG-S isoform X2 [Maniola jurtina]
MQGEGNRMWASASFVGVLFIIGLPLWWKTTEVYRVALPYDKISEFDTEAHYITTELTVLANDEQTANNLAELLKKEFEQSDVIKFNIRKQILPEDLRQTLDAVADEQEALEEVGAAFDTKLHNTFYVVQRKPLFQDVWIGGERIAFFRDSKAAPTLIQALKNWIYEPSVLHGARSETADAARQVRFPSGEGFHVVLSVVHPKPQAMTVDFTAGEAVENYIGSFVDELSDLHNFTLKSQWLHLLDFNFQTKETPDTSSWGRHFAVRHDRLPLLLTRLEERAATHVSDKPTVNLALYVVPCDMAPLAIYDTNNDRVMSTVQAFMSPKWGGVVLGSPTKDECEQKHYTPDVRLIMGTFVAQLRKLLGITDKEKIPGAHLETLRSVVPRRWEVDSLLRIRTLEQVTSAERSLKSLAKLLGEISNIVINDEVGASINQAVDSIHRATGLMRLGDLLTAHHYSQQAFLAAETAFMEPSLLALLYFPDDQKYAIYIPLFLPIMFPVVLSFKNLVLWFRGKPVHKEKTD